MKSWVVPKKKYHFFDAAPYSSSLFIFRRRNNHIAQTYTVDETDMEQCVPLINSEEQHPLVNHVDRRQGMTNHVVEQHNMINHVEESFPLINDLAQHTSVLPIKRYNTIRKGDAVSVIAILLLTDRLGSMCQNTRKT